MRTLQILNAHYPDLAGRFGPAQPIPSLAERRIASISLPDRSQAVKGWWTPRAEYFGTGFIGSSGWQDMARASRIWSSNAAQTAVFTDTGIGGERSIVLDGVISFLLDNAQVADIGLSTTAFSGFVVCRPDAGISISRYLFGSSEGSNNKTPQLLVGPSGLDTYLGRSSGFTRAAGNYLDQDLVLGVTFSTARGVTLRRNGVQVAADPSATIAMQTIDDYSMRLWGGPSSGSRFIGLGNDMVWLAADLSDPAYTAQLDYIEGAWMDQYGITRGA